MRRATSIGYSAVRLFIFLSTLSLRRATQVQQVLFLLEPKFLSTLSLRRATITTITTYTAWKFLSTLSLRRATRYDNYNLHCVEISIHALLAESDKTLVILTKKFDNFYPRSPCGERRQQPAGTTRTAYFYPRSPCGERRANNQPGQQGQHISIHALLAESDNLQQNQHQRKQISIHALLAESDPLTIRLQRRII